MIEGIPAKHIYRCDRCGASLYCEGIARYPGSLPPGWGDLLWRRHKAGRKIRGNRALLCEPCCYMVVSEIIVGILVYWCDCYDRAASRKRASEREQETSQ